MGKDLNIKSGTILIVPFFYGAFHAGLYLSNDRVIHLAPQFREIQGNFFNFTDMHTFL